MLRKLTVSCVAASTPSASVGASSSFRQVESPAAALPVKPRLLLSYFHAWLR